MSPSFANSQELINASPARNSDIRDAENKKVEGNKMYLHIYGSIGNPIVAAQTAHDMVIMSFVASLWFSFRQLSNSFSALFRFTSIYLLFC